MQSSFQFDRERIKENLGKTERIVYDVMKENPVLRNLKMGNHLIRYIWLHYGDISASSILRLARKYRVEMDTEDNIRDRANFETAYHEYLK